MSFKDEMQKIRRLSGHFNESPTPSLKKEDGKKRESVALKEREGSVKVISPTDERGKRETHVGSNIKERDGSVKTISPTSIGGIAPFIIPEMNDPKRGSVRSLNAKYVLAILMFITVKTQSLECKFDSNCPLGMKCLIHYNINSPYFENDYCYGFCVDKVNSEEFSVSCNSDTDCNPSNPRCIIPYSVCGVNKLPDGFTCTKHDDCLSSCCYFSISTHPYMNEMESSCGCPRGLSPSNILQGFTSSQSDLFYCPVGIHKQSLFFQNTCGVLDNGFPCMRNEDCSTGFCFGASGLAFASQLNTFNNLYDYVPFPSMCSDMMPAGSSPLPVDANGQKSIIWAPLQCSPDINQFICPNDEPCNLFSNLCGKSAINEGCFVNSDCQSGFCQNPNHFDGSAPALVFKDTPNDHSVPDPYGKCMSAPSSLVAPTSTTNYGDCILNAAAQSFGFSYPQKVGISIITNSTIDSTIIASCFGLNNCNYKYGLCGQTENGYPCIKNSDCVSTSFCYNNICSSVPNGQSISLNARYRDCRSDAVNINSCGSLMCNQFSGLCGYSQLNESCSINSDCTTGLCLGSMYEDWFPSTLVCSRIPKGLTRFPPGSLPNSSYCNTGGELLNGVVCPLNLNCNVATGLCGVIDVAHFPCLSSSDCGVGLFCYGLSSQSILPYCALISLYGSVPLNDTIFINGTSSCPKNDYNMFTGLCGKGYVNSTCLVNSDCSSFSFCDAGICHPFPIGQSYPSSSVSVFDACYNIFTSAGDDSEPWSKEGIDGSCPINSVCNFYTGLCGYSGIGNVCSINLDCSSGYCKLGVCAPFPKGSSIPAISPSCYSSLQCNNVDCNSITGLCGASVEINGSCSYHSDCLSAYCVNSVCAYRPSYFVPPFPPPRTKTGNCNTNSHWDSPNYDEVRVALNNNNVALFCPLGYYCDFISGLCSNQYSSNSLTFNINPSVPVSPIASKSLSNGSIVGITLGVAVLVATALFAFIRSTKQNNATIKALKEGIGAEGVAPDAKEGGKPKSNRSSDIIGTPHLRKFA